MFYEPTAEHLERLSGRWCCSYSGGKDSTSLVTWLEWLRRTGQITPERPQLVQSDTMVEDTGLQSLSRDMMALLRDRGWECAVVEPRVNERLYCQILGRGVTPVHAGGRKMRWCTRATKIDPMKRWRKVHSAGLTLTGLRIGESAIRDGKILKSLGCSSGGECGIPNPDESEAYAPRSVIARYGKESPLNELYDVWFEARRRDNRLVRFREGKDGRGPIKMAVRRVLFDRVMDIQRRAGIVLVAPEDEAFIRQCWADKVYPRGWSEADEDTLPPDSTPLFGKATP